jgi:ABC-type nitrate/sulfonate/bicarbonate transport system permease component
MASTYTAKQKMPPNRAAFNGLVLGLGPYILGFGTLFLAWHVTSVYLFKSSLFPPPLAVFRRMIELLVDGTLVANMGVSLQRILIGFILGSVAGIAIGLAMGTFVTVKRIIEPWTELLRFIPSVAMITIAVIWFGIGENSKIFLIIYTTVFIVILNTAAGVAAITPNKIRAAQMLGATRAQTFVYVSLPATVPYILTGMRIAMANSFTTIVAAEMVAASSGLGYMLWNGRLFMQVEDIFVSLLALCFLGLVTDRIFRLGIAKFAGRYSPII